ncbi:peptidase M14 [Meridianimaribacter sp. CL38]|uniref:M14 family zinc carboxypeptidase n=1 Tax=Meridianimaribacter sp. CL38 TaxID=2213021 RepID=UPI001038FA18|nr:M14 family zinc carboxypeptidase [Meridianimaribacter sp. CL38]TBV26725.1 peptidase M14 [Meridianimaribacter sp. CL38]
MDIELIKNAYSFSKEKSLYHRYICNDHIVSLLNNLPSNFSVDVIGESVNGEDIFSVTVGKGEKRLLLWSQMHGNESTTTKALFDVFNFLTSNNSYAKAILNNCTLKIIPILNPDGARAYTRVNANEVDLNRDAQNLTQPESLVLKTCFEGFKPDYCYNLHGQRTIFSAGKSNNSAIVSFLSPAQDEARSLSKNRRIAMEVISVMNNALQQVIPNKVGIYDDAFNINCVGDTFQHKGVPTILFEAGHFPNDYAREETRALIFNSLLTSFNYISSNNVEGEGYESYFDIPANEKLFFDIIIRNADVNGEILDIAIQYEERLKENSIIFVPKIQKISKLENFYAHREINANNSKVLDAKNGTLKVESENDFVLINNQKTSLYL